MPPPNGQHPTPPTPHQQPLPAEMWPVPLTAGPGHINTAVLDGTNEHGHPIKLIRLELYTTTGAAILYLEAAQAIQVFGQALTLARAARSGLHLPGR
jgi:hypothetical protein